MRERERGREGEERRERVMLFASGVVGECLSHEGIVES